MTEQNKWASIRAGVVAVIVLAAVLIAGGCKEKPAEPPDTERQQQGHTPPEAPAQDTNKPPKPDSTVGIPPKPSIEDVIRRARTWGPAYTSWYGKTAPDFTVTDIAGKQHKLSDYRGKDVMLVFWATWCPPCKAEIPHLIVLRNTISRDKLAILAVSNERPDVVEKYVSSRNLNYTVLLEKGDMPAPFGVMRLFRTSGIPGSFFIKPDGKIKVATTGLLRLSDMKAILEAE